MCCISMISIDLTNMFFKSHSLWFQVTNVMNIIAFVKCPPPATPPPKNNQWMLLGRNYKNTCKQPKPVWLIG